MVERMVPFNKPYMVGSELGYIAEAHSHIHLSGDGLFTKRCHGLLEQLTGCRKALLTHSCTAALEMAAMLIDLRPGDEVIIPSFTFVSTANAFVLRGAIPVFVDIRPDTFNIDERLIEQAITPRTRAICVVHYAGIACDMDAIMQIADKHGLLVVEDAAQAIMSSHKGRPLGSIGHLGALSFHETKNVICGEGGALLINSPQFIERAEILREKGTNRSRFFRGQIDKYTWVDIGSSYLPSEVVAAFLYAQLERAKDITERRKTIWRRYDEWFRHRPPASPVPGLPHMPDRCEFNAHIYPLLLPDLDARTHFIEEMRARGVQTVFHYLPLHSSPAGLQYGRVGTPMPNTDSISERLVRLPLWLGMEDFMPQVFHALEETLDQIMSA